MTIYERVMNDRNVPGADRPLLSLIAGEICIDGKPMDDDSSIKRLSQMAKTCDKNIELYTKALNLNMSLNEAAFKDMIEVYLPKGATVGDVERAMVELDVECDIKSMGRVMGHLKKSFKVVDGNMVKTVLLGA